MGHVMALDGREVRRVDIGDGIYVPVPAPAVAGPAAAAPGDTATAPVAQQPSRHAPPLALAAGAGLSAAAIARFGFTAEGLLAAGLLPVLVVLAAIDIRARVLPNRIIGPAMLAVLVWQLAFFPDRVPECLLAAVGASAFLLLPCIVQPGAMGMGDVKLAALLGLTLGADVVGALLVGFVAGMPVALALLLLRGAEARKTAIPFGPFLALGAAVALLV
jgi:leader peptidase (prepilin peptidase) / N-methyltransferase